ncbi:MAG: branched-chain-amino-acid transaminase [Candidatus Portnoybacteria bacterium]|nr:branched-chain-amino-acid transaminase [Candidatus Portnoybacteria bacterium]
MVYINGKLVSQDKAKISIFDRSFLYGDAVFETMRGYAGIIFKLDAHLTRLLSSLKALKIRHGYTKDHLKEAVYKTLNANKLKSAYVRLVITRGEGRFGIGYKDTFTPNLIIVAKNFDGYPEWMFLKGVSAKIMGVQNEYSILSNIKSSNYLNFILARFDAQGMGFNEAVLTNTKGNVTEGATSNIFIVRSDSLITPSINSGVLPGITRSVIIDIARKLKLPVKEKAVSRRELISADEVFLTNSLAEVLPVTKVEGRKIGEGTVGPVTKLLHISYQKEVIREVLK